MKISLINPNLYIDNTRPPLGLLSIAAVTRQAGHDVEIIDANLENYTPDDILPLIADSDIIGITAMTSSIYEAMRIAGKIKHNTTGKGIVLGGVHATVFPQEMIETNLFDVVVQGEGDMAFINIVKALQYGYREYPYILKGCEVDINRLPFPAYDLIDVGRYNPHSARSQKMPWTSISTSRGCPFICSFCAKAVFGNKFRAMSPMKVADLMAELKHKYKINELVFYDDIFTLDKARVHELCDLIIKCGLKVDWSCEARVNLVDRELLEHMKAAGCTLVAYGIESGSDKILKTLSKGITKKGVRKAIQLTKDAGLQTLGYFMMGSPGETLETIKETPAFAIELGLDYAQFGITSPQPGSKLYLDYVEMGYEVPGWDKFQYVSDDDKPMFTSSHLSKADIIESVIEANKMFQGNK